MPDKDRVVTVDIETATETVTREEDVHRIRREAGLEQGEPPSRGVPSPGGEADTPVEREAQSPD